MRRERDALIDRIATTTARWARSRRFPLDPDDAYQTAYVALLATDRPTHARARGAIIDQLRGDSNWSRRTGTAPTVVELEEWDHPADVAPGPADHVDGAELLDVLVGLSWRQRFVLAALDAGWPLAEIGVRLGVTESRVCQIRRTIKEVCR